MKNDVFISYSSKDKNIADAACAILEKHRIRCWIAPRNILPGVDYAEGLINAINESKVMALIFSSNSNQSGQVLREVERAVSKGIPIIPFRIEDVPLSKQMEFYISTHHWLDAMDPPLEKHLNRLSETIRAVLSLHGSIEIEDNPIKKPILSSQDLTSLENRAFKLFSENKFHDASKLYQQLLSHDYNLGKTYYNLGMCFEYNRDGIRRGSDADLEKALLYYDLSIKNNYENIHDSYLNAAMVENDMGRYHAAEIRLKEAQKIAGWNYQIHGALGMALVNQGKHEEATHVLNKSLEIEPDDLAAIYNIALSYQNIGNKKEALRYYLDFVDNFENHAAVLPNMASSMRSFIPTARQQIQKLKYSP